MTGVPICPHLNSHVQYLASQHDTRLGAEMAHSFAS
jgi:hypothetical protein